MPLGLVQGCQSPGVQGASQPLLRSPWPPSGHQLLTSTNGAQGLSSPREPRPRADVSTGIWMAWTGGEAPSGLWVEAWVCLGGFRGGEEGPLQPHPSPSYPHPCAPQASPWPTPPAPAQHNLCSGTPSGSVCALTVLQGWAPGFGVPPILRWSHCPPVPNGQWPAGQDVAQRPADPGHWAAFLGWEGKRGCR